MNKKSLGLVLVASMATLAAASALQGGVLLRRELKPESTESYKVEATTKTIMNTPMGEQDMETDTAMIYAVKINKVDESKGVAEVETTTTVEKMEVGGSVAAMMGGGLEKPKPMKLVGTLDNRNRLKADATKAMSPEMMMMAGAAAMNMGMLIELPEKTVEPGQTWDVVIPKNPLFSDKDQTMKVTLVGEKNVDGTSYWEIRTNGVINTLMNSEELAKAGGTQASGMMSGMKIIAKGTIDVTSQGLIDKVTGKTVSLVSKLKIKQTIELTDMGMTIDSNGTGTQKVTLMK